MIIPANVDFSMWIDFVGKQESQEIHPAGYFEDAVLNRIREGVQVRGDLLPWRRTHDKVGLRGKELTLWAGFNGHKKSLLLGYVMLHLAKTRRVAIASMEMSPSETLYRMACHVSGCEISDEYYRRFSAWSNERIFIYDQLDKVPAERILGFVHYAAKHIGCKHIVIDSLTKCGIAKDDGNAEKDFVDRLQWAAKTLDVNVHLVCHMRKPSDEKEPPIPTKYTIRGASEISDLADNVFIVHSNMRKKNILNKLEGGAILTDSEQQELKKPDQFLALEKQRHGHCDMWTWGLWHNGFQFKSEDTTRRVEFSLEG